jgi:hypothetical protein
MIKKTKIIEIKRRMTKLDKKIKWNLILSEKLKNKINLKSIKSKTNSNTK